MRIALTTDFSDFAARAFRAGASLARALGAQLDLVHQARWNLPPPAGAGMDIDTHHASLQKHLEYLASSSPQFDGLSVGAHLVRGGDVQALNEELTGYDLLLTATHGRKGLSRFFMGSFAEKLVRVSPCNVLVIRGEEDAFPPRKILVAHDFSKSTTTSVDLACDWAGRFDSEVKLLSVVDTEERVIKGVEAEYLSHWDEFYDLVRQNAMNALRELANREDWRALTPTIDVVDGQPADRILEEAESFDLVIVGRHGKTAAERLYVGSVADTIVRRARCSVLIVEHYD